MLSVQERNKRKELRHTSLPPIEPMHSPYRTEQEAKAVLLASGTTVAAWARERGFNVPLARMVLAGKRKCLRGQSLEIAIALGIKAETPAHSIAG